MLYNSHAFTDSTLLLASAFAVTTINDATFGNVNNAKNSNDRMGWGHFELGTVLSNLTTSYVRLIPNCHMGKYIKKSQYSDSSTFLLAISFSNGEKWLTAPVYFIDTRTDVATPVVANSIFNLQGETLQDFRNNIDKFTVALDMSRFKCRIKGKRFATFELKDCSTEYKRIIENFQELDSQRYGIWPGYLLPDDSMDQAVVPQSYLPGIYVGTDRHIVLSFQMSIVQYTLGDSKFYLQVCVPNRIYFTAVRWFASKMALTILYAKYNMELRENFLQYQILDRNDNTYHELDGTVIHTKKKMHKIIKKYFE